MSHATSPCCAGASLAAGARAAFRINQGFVERNREPVPMLWLNQDVFGGTQGHLHVTESDNDG